MKKLGKQMVAFVLLLAMAAGVGSAMTSPAEAGRLKRPFIAVQPDLQFLPRSDTMDLAQAEDDGGAYDSPVDEALTIRPREAARIARQMVPGAKVLNVRLLPSGVYAVTLRGDGQLTRVMVDGRTGDIL